MRVELFGDEVESLRWFSTFTQRSLAEAEASRSRPRRSSDPDLPRAGRAGRDARRGRAPGRRRGAAGRPLPLVPGAAARSSAACRAGRRGGAAARRSPTTGRTSPRACTPTTPTTSTCRPRQVAAGARQAGRGDASRPSRRTSRTASARRPPTPPRASIQEAEPELEKLVRSGYLTVVAWARRGEAERAAYNLARLRPRASIDGDGAGDGATARALWFAVARAARGLHRAAAASSR